MLRCIRPHPDRHSPQDGVASAVLRVRPGPPGGTRLARAVLGGEGGTLPRARARRPIDSPGAPRSADLDGSDQAATHAFSGATVPYPMPAERRSEEHTSELQSLMRISYAVFCLKKHKKQHTQ